MIQIAVNLKDVTQSGIIQRGQDVLTALTGNPNVPTPKPTLPEIEAAITAAQTARQNYDVAVSELRALKAIRDAAVHALADVLRAEAATVLVATGGDRAKILSAGFRPKSAGSPVGTPDQVVNLAVEAAEAEGVLKAKWKPVPGVSAYEIQVSAEPPASMNWVNRGSVTKAKAVLDGFTSGTKIWVRVRGVGSAGGGAWSNAGSKIVP